jgi:hypothetical protein
MALSRLAHTVHIRVDLSVSLNFKIKSSPAVLSNGSTHCSLRGMSCMFMGAINSFVFKGLNGYNKVKALISKVGHDIRNSTALNISNFR